MLMPRPQQPQITGVAADKFPFRQHLHNFTLCQRLAGGKQRQAADPQMLFNRIETHGGVVGGVAPVGLNCFAFTFATELPARVGGRFAKADAAVRPQFLRRVRHTVAL